jgi:hypothetical protein
MEEIMDAPGKDEWFTHEYRGPLAGFAARRAPPSVRPFRARGHTPERMLGA